MWSSPEKEHKVVIFGISGAGKTTILYKIKEEDVEVLPTTSFNLEPVTFKDVNFSFWDLSGQGVSHVLWHKYLHGTKALMFVVDSTDFERMPEAKERLWMILESPEVESAILLIFANKQDLPEARSILEIFEDLDLKNLKNRKWKLIGTSGTTGDGLSEGIGWLASKKFTKKMNS
ncbi:unnamed protein product [Caenorhabditis auriculariae]|uniref:ADP-ribosylation factor-like protein 6 n=1 Tax=Caenorhabditis auriculariae TaxID=2777116 RepID=A0A8S1HEE0_9PELO|nr:unnamed protein product [Caenorhabditis auriculariae]